MKRIAGALAVGLAVSLTAGVQHAAAQEPDGAALYRQHCRTCHGARGVPSSRMKGLYPEIESLADSTLPDRISVDSMVKLMITGAGDMKPLGEKMTRAEMVAVAEFVRTLSKSGS